MVPSHRRFGFAEADPALNPRGAKGVAIHRAGALFPGDWIFEEFLLATLGDIGDKVVAGGTPATPATPVGGYPSE